MFNVTNQERFENLAAGEFNRNDPFIKPIWDNLEKTPNLKVMEFYRDPTGVTLSMVVFGTSGVDILTMLYSSLILHLQNQPGALYRQLELTFKTEDKPITPTDFSKIWTCPVATLRLKGDSTDLSGIEIYLQQLADVVNALSGSVVIFSE